MPYKLLSLFSIKTASLLLIFSDKEWVWHYVSSLDILGRWASSLANLSHRFRKMGSHEKRLGNVRKYKTDVMHWLNFVKSGQNQAEFLKKKTFLSQLSTYQYHLEYQGACTRKSTLNWTSLLNRKAKEFPWEKKESKGFFRGSRYTLLAVFLKVRNMHALNLGTILKYSNI